MNMLLRPFARFCGAKPAPAIPEGMRVYAFGDVHGRADLLRMLLTAIFEDVSAERRAGGLVEIIGLGDYIDRGQASREVLDLLLSQDLPAGARLTVLKGNHEEAFLAALADRAAMAPWLEYGGGTTMVSYGVPPIAGAPNADRVGRMWTSMREAVPQAHLAFLAAMPTHCQFGDYLFVHAGIRPGLTLERQSDRDLLWIREEFLTSRRRHPMMIVHGHHIVESPEIRPNRIGIDTGAYCTNVLTCLVLEGTGRRLLQATPTGVRRSALPPK